MATLRIIEKQLNYYRFEVENDLVPRQPLENRRNDLTVEGEFAHFKTSEGAAIVYQQDLLPTDVTVVDIDDNEYVPTDMDQLKGYLDDIHFFDWQSNYGGGGGGGATAFTDLTDTFNYVGKQGFVPRVNASETGLEAVSTLLHDKITQHTDYSPQNTPIAAADVGKKVTVQLVSGNPKFVLSNDTTNSPIPPNALLSDFTPTNDGDEWTVPALRAWRVNDIVYSNPADFVQEILPAATGKIRQDIFYVTTDNDIHYLAGTEGDITAPIPVTSVPANSITALTFTVTEESTTPAVDPYGNPWVTKVSYGGVDVYATGTGVNLPRGNKTHYFIHESVEIVGLTTVSYAPDDDQNYTNQHFYFQNSDASTVVLKHLNIDAEIPFNLPNGDDYELPNFETAEFFYNKVTNSLDFVGKFAGGSGVTPHSLKVEYDETDITVPSGFEISTIINLKDVDAEVDADVAGTLLTVNSGAYDGDILFITGYY